jgi:hypothetical protein
MRFLKSNFWVLAVLLALFGQFSPLAARFCSMTQSPMLCMEISSAAHGEKCEFTQAVPCGQCCQQSDSMVAILQSAPLISSPRQEFSTPSIEVVLLAQHIWQDVSPDCLIIREVFHEIDLPPPLEGVGSTFSCRAPPVKV